MEKKEKMKKKYMLIWSRLEYYFIVAKNEKMKKMILK